MIIENIKKTGSERILNYIQLSEGRGKGTQEDPFMIESSESIPKHLRIINSNSYVNFNKRNFDLLILKKCQNIKISNCNIQVLQLENCAKTKIENCQFHQILSVRKGNQNNINTYPHCINYIIQNCFKFRHFLLLIHISFI